MFRRVRLNRFSFFTGLLVMALIGGGVVATLFTYRTVDGLLKQSIISRTETIAKVFDPAPLAFLEASTNDLTNPEYLLLKERLMAIREVNADARFVYLMGQRDDGTIFFYADSEVATSNDYSPPGQAYFEASDNVKRAFTTGESLVETASDRWGYWMSGIAPIVDKGSGKVVAVAGLDVDMAEYIPALIAYAALPALGTIILLLIVLMLYQMHRAEDRVIDERAELLSVASHEIRSPLTGIRWAIEAMLDDPGLTPELQKKMGTVYESALLILDRINNLLAVNVLEQKKRTTASYARVTVLPIIEAIVGMLRLTALQKSLTIVIDDGLTQEVSLVGDSEALRTLFANLISNAVKYGDSGTQVSVGYALSGKKHIFTITNRGAGIPKGDMPHIFSGFYRAKNVAGHTDGTGMGLYLAKNIVEMHGGKITVTSVEGGDTVFTVSIPA